MVTRWAAGSPGETSKPGPRSGASSPRSSAGAVGRERCPWRPPRGRRGRARSLGAAADRSEVQEVQLGLDPPDLPGQADGEAAGHRGELCADALKLGHLGDGLREPRCRRERVGAEDDGRTAVQDDPVLATLGVEERTPALFTHLDVRQPSSTFGGRSGHPPRRRPRSANWPASTVGRVAPVMSIGNVRIVTASRPVCGRSPRRRPTGRSRAGSGRGS